MHDSERSVAITVRLSAAAHQTLHRLAPLEHRSPTGQAAYHVGGVASVSWRNSIGEAKRWHGLRRFRLRRLPKVNTEALLTAAGQHLKRLLQRRG